MVRRGVVLEQGRLQLDYIQMGLLQGVGHHSAVDGAALSVCCLSWAKWLGKD